MQPLLRLSLLDRLCGAVGLTPHNRLVVHQRRPLPGKLPVRLKTVSFLFIRLLRMHFNYGIRLTRMLFQLMSGLSSWNKMIDNVRHSMNASLHAPESVSVFADPNPAKLNEEQLAYKRGLQGLIRAGSHASRAGLEVVLLNVELMGFVIGWLSAVSRVLQQGGMLLTFVKNLGKLPDSAESMGQAILR
jgi:hypothetical protein